MHWWEVLTKCIWPWYQLWHHGKLCICLQTRWKNISCKNDFSRLLGRWIIDCMILATYQYLDWSVQNVHGSRVSQQWQCKKNIGRSSAREVCMMIASWRLQWSSDLVKHHLEHVTVAGKLVVLCRTYKAQSHAVRSGSHQTLNKGGQWSKPSFKFIIFHWPCWI